MVLLSYVRKYLRFPNVQTMKENIDRFNYAKKLKLLYDKR